MKLQHVTRRGRHGFTLVELLVVIAIIAVLVGMVTAVVLRFLVKGPQTKTQNEISQLTNAVQTFQTTYKVGVFPSRIVLAEKVSYYDPNNPLHTFSVKYLSDMFPGLLRPDANAGGAIVWASVGIDWNGNGQIDAFDKGGLVMLEGDQCLVFFLGGIPTNQGGIGGCLGFSTNTRNPAQPGGERKGPFYEFVSDRLKDLRGNGFYSYIDGWDKLPYAYFSSYGKRNGYNRFYGLDGKSDCNSLGVWPYAEALVPTMRYLNPESFQIISSGEDNAFGQGSNLTVTPVPTWTRANASASPAISNSGRAGADDQSNFYDNQLGVAY